MFKDLLAYQKLDLQKIRLEQSIENNPAKIAQEKLKAFRGVEQGKLLKLVDSAEGLLKDYEKCKADYENAYKAIVAITKEDPTTSEDKLVKAIEELEKLEKTLTSISRALSSQNANASTVVKDVDTCKANIIESRKKLVEGKQKIEDYEKSIVPQIAEIEKQMHQMEKSIDKSLLEKYNHLRQDKIIPVLVPLNANACGGCSMSLSASHLNKLKENGYLECEQCRRYIYID